MLELSNRNLDCEYMVGKDMLYTGFVINDDLLLATDGIGTTYERLAQHCTLRFVDIFFLVNSAPATYGWYSLTARIVVRASYLVAMIIRLSIRWFRVIES